MSRIRSSGSLLRAGGLVGDGKGNGRRVLREPARIQFLVELETLATKALRSGGDTVADCRRPADGAQAAGAIERMEPVSRSPGAYPMA
jgi:hypothetical protein